MRKSLTLSKEH